MYGFIAPRKAVYSKETRILWRAFCFLSAAAIVLGLMAAPTSPLSTTYGIIAGILVVFAVIFLVLAIHSTWNDPASQPIGQD